ncbi:hypothetical protein Pan241w_38020 [Gimesia alba]|uniref:Uncharacterized protein n=1 Tax=Gimesia alba TaxID=2527973 RepID=A0A517RIL1_9PLAN|nr:hypothetical protein [Gimesia alba]QDT43700.1 hypothetical protein Pan241w_38020 [Gimesia alba]
MKLSLCLPVLFRPGIFQRAGIRIVVSFLLSTIGLSVGIAQTSSQPDPFNQVSGPEFSAVVKAVSQNDYDLALKLSSDLRRDAIKTRNRELQSEVIATIKEVNRLKREFHKLGSVYELMQKSKDPEACRTIGNFYCLDKGDWQAGLKLLTKSDSPDLQATAAADLKRPVTPEEQAKLADAWWKVAEKEKGVTRKAYLLRGRYWYLLARPRLPAIECVDRNKKLLQIPLSSDKIVIWNQHNGEYANHGTDECIVTLLYQGKSVWRQVVRVPWKPDAPAYRVIRPPNVRFDQIKVDITKYLKKGGGLGEIEVFDGTINLVQNSSAFAKEYHGNERTFHPSNVIDGDKSGATGFWLLNRQHTGWVAIDLVNQLEQP